MKAVLCAAALLLVGALVYFDFQMLHLRSKHITFALYEGDELKFASDRPATNFGYSGENSIVEFGFKSITQAHLNTTIVDTDQGQPGLQFHLVKNRDGAVTVIDRVVPVFDQKPEKKNWSKLDEQFTAYAYMEPNL